MRETEARSGQRVHLLKVQPPYFEPLTDGSKTFEVRKNDRAFQSGDIVRLMEWLPGRCFGKACEKAYEECPAYTGDEVQRRISFVYSGDPRFGGIEPGFVVLALSAVSDDR